MEKSSTPKVDKRSFTLIKIVRKVIAFSCFSREPSSVAAEKGMFFIVSVEKFEQRVKH